MSESLSSRRIVVVRSLKELNVGEWSTMSIADVFHYQFVPAQRFSPCEAPRLRIDGVMSLSASPHNRRHSITLDVSLADNPSQSGPDDDTKTISPRTLKRRYFRQGCEIRSGCEDIPASCGLAVATDSLRLVHCSSDA